MGSTTFGAGGKAPAASWANETLPLTLRRELLARELEKLGFARAGAQEAGSGIAAQRQQQEARVPEGPQAEPPAAKGSQAPC